MRIVSTKQTSGHYAQHANEADGRAATELLHDRILRLIQARTVTPIEQGLRQEPMPTCKARAMKGCLPTVQSG